MIVDSFPGHLLGQQITALGQAFDAHSGAVVMLSDRTPLYVAGLDCWDDDFLRKQVRVSGVLRRRKLAPDPTVNAKGEVSHGKEGSDFVIEEAHWELA
jgi:hypothetical protein